MIEIAIMVEGQMGLTWPRWRAVAEAVDGLGFSGLYRSDHFTNPRGPDEDSLELVVSLTYLATHTQRIRFGPMVAPVSFRDPVMLARQALQIDDLSGGRMVLGLGAGWQEREHALFGYHLGDVATRMARFEEALEVTTRLLRDAEAGPFTGKFYTLGAEAALLPRPQRPAGPPVLIGGNGARRTLPLTARYATIWNAAFLSPEGFREHSALLDRELAAVGRPPEAVRRTLAQAMFFGRDEAELARVLEAAARRRPELAGKPAAEAVAALRARGVVVGTPEQVRQQIAEYEAAGVAEIMLQWFDLDDTERLRAFAEAVLPR